MHYQLRHCGNSQILKHSVSKRLIKTNTVKYNTEYVKYLLYFTAQIQD